MTREVDIYIGADPSDEERQLSSKEELMQFEAEDRLICFVLALDNFENFIEDDGDDTYISRKNELLACARDIANRFEQYVEHEVLSLDEAMGLRRPKGYRRKVEREFFLKISAVQRTAFYLWAAGAVIDDAFFEALGQVHGMKKSKASDMYYFGDRPNKGQPRPPPGAWPLPDEYAECIPRLTWAKGYFPVLLRSTGITE